MPGIENRAPDLTESSNGSVPRQASAHRLLNLTQVLGDLIGQSRRQRAFRQVGAARLAC